MRCTISKKITATSLVKAIFEDNLDKLPTFAQNE